MSEPPPSALQRLLLAYVVILLAACSSPRVFANEDPSAEFWTYRTYGFLEKLGTDTAEYGSILSEHLKTAASRELENRGYTRAEEPDLLVNFVLLTEEKQQIRTTTMPPARRGRVYGGYPGYETSSYEYTEGTLEVDLIDRRQNQLVWQGVVVGKITDRMRDELGEAVDRAVGEVFEQFRHEAARPLSSAPES